jgi:sialic acid synthase SpsE
MSRTFVIGEPGSTAEGNFDTMCELIRVAADCGANCVKPQWVSSADAHLQRRTANLSAAEREQFRAEYAESYSYLEWPVDWHREFAFRCHNLGMEYAVSVCLPQDVWTLEPYVDRFKISSFESCDHRLVATVLATRKPVLVSNGMSVETVEYWGRNRLLCASDRLLCTSAYPTPLDEVNLLVIERCGLGGYSDHTRNVIAGSQAVAYGAQVIEAHYRLDSCNPQNKDYPVSFTPAEFAQYITYIRQAEAMRGDGAKTIQPCEEPMLRYKVGV